MKRTAYSDVSDVVTCCLRQGAELSPAGHPTVDQSRVVFEQHIRSKAKPLHYPWSETLDEPVARSYKCAHRGNAVWFLEVYFYKLSRTCEGISWVGGTSRPMQYDYLGAVVSKHHSAKWRRTYTSDLHYANAV